MDGRVEYEPASAKELLVELKDTAELLVDLSFSAVLHGSDDVADEVLRLEERMGIRLIAQIQFATGAPKDMFVSSGFERRPDGAADHAAVSGNVDGSRGVAEMHKRGQAV